MIPDNHGHDPAQTTPSERIPDDIELDEAGRNWVQRHQAHTRPLRQMAADAAITAAIGGVYGAG